MTPPDSAFLVITNSPLEPHQREPSEAFLDRVLGLSPRDRRAFCVDGAGDVWVRDERGVRRCELPPSRVAVLRAVAALEAAEPQSGRRRHDGAGWVLCDEAGTTFLLTQKDDKHPNPKSRGRLACMSGAVEHGETPEQGALRELYEELRDVAMADEIASCAESLGAPELPSVQWPGSYRMAAWLARARASSFARWLSVWRSGEALSEACAVVMTREALAAAIADERAASGSRFVASHHEIFAMALETVRGR